MKYTVHLAVDVVTTHLFPRSKSLRIEVEAEDDDAAVEAVSRALTKFVKANQEFEKP